MSTLQSDFPSVAIERNNGPNQCIFDNDRLTNNICLLHKVDIEKNIGQQLEGHLTSDNMDDVSDLAPAKIRITQNKIGQKTVNKCTCFVAGPANRLCPVHEMDIVEVDDDQHQSIKYTLPEKDSLTDLLENVGFDTPNSPEGIIDEYTETIVNPLFVENNQIIHDNNNIADRVDGILDNYIINHPPRLQEYLRATNSDNVEIQYCGQLQGICQHCNAKYFLMEQNQMGTYSTCCKNGKVYLPPYRQPSMELRRLFKGQHPLSKPVTYTKSFSCLLPILDQFYSNLILYKTKHFIE